MKIKFEKEKFSTVKDFGHSNAKFYGYCIIDGKRYGTTWKFNDGKYVVNQDFDRQVHNANNRPKQFVAETISELKAKLNESEV